MQNIVLQSLGQRIAELEVEKAFLKARVADLEAQVAQSQETPA